MENLISHHFTLHIFCLFALPSSQQVVNADAANDLSEDQSTRFTYFFDQHTKYPRDCQEIQDHCSVSNASGVHLIRPDGYPSPFEVFCDNSEETGGWTIIQRRTDGSIDFNRGWTDNLNGFGYLNSEFWLGNDKVTHLTNQKIYELQIDMMNSVGSLFYVNYNMFRLSDDWGEYKLINLGKYSGNAGHCIETCPQNMVYDKCACQVMCNDPSGCRKNCNDGEDSCICPHGLYLDGNNTCVSEQECSCFVDGFGIIPNGESYVNSDCTRRCFCIANELNCEEDFHCSINATCQETEDTHRCQCKDAFEGDGQICTAIPTDCLELYNAGYTSDGVYTIHPTGWSGPKFDVYCDMTTDGGGWTVFQHRMDGSVNFTRSWSTYKAGFGNLSGEHWLGNDKIHAITYQDDYQLRVDLVASGGYNALEKIEGGAFSTHDHDNDHSSFNCADKHRGGWWYTFIYFKDYSRCNRFQAGQYYWFCANANLNGDYSGGNGENIFWINLAGNDCNIRKSEMKIRPV